MVNTNTSPKGFTLVELIVVILLIAILGITVLPKLQGTSEYQLVSHRDQFISMLRTVQMRAMQNTQNDSSTCHRVLFLSGQAGLAAQEAASGDCQTVLVDTTNAQIQDFLVIDDIQNYTAVSGNSATINFVDFDSLGRPTPDAGNCFRRCTITIETYKVCIESEGYIYDCS